MVQRFKMEHLGEEEVSAQKVEKQRQFNLLIKTKPISIKQELNLLNFDIQVNLNTGFINSPDKDITIKFTQR